MPSWMTSEQVQQVLEVVEETKQLLERLDGPHMEQAYYALKERIESKEMESEDRLDERPNERP